MNPLPIRVVVPPDERYVRVLRVVASSSGVTAGLPIDRLEELSLAIDEAAAAVLAVPHVASLECKLAAGSGHLAVEVTGTGGSAEHWPPDDWDQSLAAMVLSGVAADVRLTTAGPDPTLHFTLSPG